MLFFGPLRPTYVERGVLTLCRILCSLETGDYVTKPGAVEWAQNSLPARWQPLISRAIQGRQQPGENPIPGDIEETWAFLRYVQERGFIEDY